MADEKQAKGMATPPRDAPSHERFEKAYTAYVAALQEADADAHKTAYELYCDHQRDLWDAARDQSTERASNARDTYQRMLADVWKSRSDQFESAYSSYLAALRDAFAGTDLDRLDWETLSSVGHSMMLAAQGAAVAKSYAPPPTAQ